MIRNFLPIRTILQMPAYEHFTPESLRDFANKYDVSMYPVAIGYVIDIDELNQKLPFYQNDLSEQYRISLYNKRFAQIKLNVLRTASCISLYWLLYGYKFASFEKKTYSIYQGESIFLALSNSFYVLALSREIHEKKKQLSFAKTKLDQLPNNNKSNIDSDLAHRAHARAQNELDFFEKKWKKHIYFTKNDLQLFLNNQFDNAVGRKINESKTLDLFRGYTKFEIKNNKEEPDNNWLFNFLKEITELVTADVKATDTKDVEESLKKFITNIDKQFDFNYLNDET